MNATRESFKEDRLEIEVVQNSGTQEVDVRWKGVSDQREPAKTLGPYLTRLADSLSAQCVTVDFRKFEYMNSATVAPIIQFIKQLDSRAEEAVLRYDPQVYWQRVNFSCVKTIAQMLHRVRVEGC